MENFEFIATLLVIAAAIFQQLFRKNLKYRRRPSPPSPSGREDRRHPSEVETDASTAKKLELNLKEAVSTEEFIKPESYAPEVPPLIYDFDPALPESQSPPMLGKEPPFEEKVEPKEKELISSPLPTAPVMPLSRRALLTRSNLKKVVIQSELLKPKYF